MITLTADYREPLMQFFFGVVFVADLLHRARVRELVAAGYATSTPSGYFLLTPAGVEACVTRGWDKV